MQRTGEKLAYEDDEWSWLGGCIQENVSNRLRRVERAIRTLCSEVLREGIVRKVGCRKGRNRKRVVSLD